jgi:hypothetical protein
MTYIIIIQLLCANLLTGYGFATFLFLIGSSEFTPFRRIKDAYLSFSNITAMVIAIVLLIALMCRYTGRFLNPTDETPFIFPISYVVLAILINGVLPFLFLFRKLRINALFSLLMAVLLNILTVYDMVRHFIGSFAGDHLNWSQAPGYYLNMLYWGIGFFLVIFLLARWKTQRTVRQTA